MPGGNLFKHLLTSITTWLYSGWSLTVSRLSNGLFSFDKFKSKGHASERIKPKLKKQNLYIDNEK